MRFFFDSKSAEARDLQSPKKFYQTLLHQLLKQIRKHGNLSPHCFKMAREKLKHEDMDENSLKEVIRDVLAMVPRGFLIVDALDECRSNDPKFLEEWFESLKGFPNLQTVITSRSEWFVEDLADERLYIVLHLSSDSVKSKLNKDIRLFIQDRIQRYRGLPKEMGSAVAILEERSDVSEN
jgi:hypothetical protein